MLLTILPLALLAFSSLSSVAAQQCFAPTMDPTDFVTTSATAAQICASIIGSSIAFQTKNGCINYPPNKVAFVVTNTSPSSATLSSTGMLLPPLYE